MIRKINKNDINIIYNMGSKYMDNFVSTYNLDNYICNNNYLCFCYEDNTIKGFILSVKTIDDIEIEFIYVDEMFRKKGIGKKLIEKMLEYNKSVLLEVSVDNRNALNLYLKLGFKEVNRRVGYYNGIDAIMMRKEITHE